MQKVKYLNFIISQEGVSTNIDKTKAVKIWPSRKNVRQIHGFLDLTGWYQIFIQTYAWIYFPIQATLNKVKVFIWTQLEKKAFKVLKEILISAPLLAFPYLRMVVGKR